MIRRFELHRRDVADRLQQPPVIEPVDPFQRCVFDGLQMPSGAATVNDLGLVEPDDRLGQCVVSGVAPASHRGLGACFGQPLGVANRQILAAAVAVMDDTLDAGARPQRLLQGVQHQFSPHRARHAPAD